jgi:hypothetical protein
MKVALVLNEPPQASIATGDALALPRLLERFQIGPNPSDQGPTHDQSKTGSYVP